MRYRIQQADGKWVIGNARESGLLWSGMFWCDPEQRGGAHPLTFADEDEAEEYARRNFGRGAIRCNSKEEQV